MKNTGLLLLLSCAVALIFLETGCAPKSTVYSSSTSKNAQIYKNAPAPGGGAGARYSSKRRTRKGGRPRATVEFMQAVGFQFKTGVNRNIQYGYPTFGAFYHPRINLGIWSDNGSFSMDFPISFGYSYGNDFLTYSSPLLVPERKGGFTAEVPLTFNFNFGEAATKNGYANFGFFIGTGYSFGYIPQGVAIQGAMPILHGPRGQMGFRFPTGPVSWQLMSHFTYNIYQPSHLIGVGLGVTFGKY